MNKIISNFLQKNLQAAGEKAANVEFKVILGSAAVPKELKK
ncbi:hypothetical protein [Paenibacillus sp. RUD330]|nr:hypothetical protein [Paenibacillus sp. RUD330]